MAGSRAAVGAHPARAEVTDPALSPGAARRASVIFPSGRASGGARRRRVGGQVPGISEASPQGCRGGTFTTFAVLDRISGLRVDYAPADPSPLHQRRQACMTATETASASAATPCEWSHTAIIRGDQPRAMARAFVCTTLGLSGHRLFHLVDIVQMVACELAANASVRARSPVTMILSRTGDVIRLVTQGASAPEADSRDRAADAYGSRLIQLLSLQWGSFSEHGNDGVWVTFDASQQNAAHSARRISNFTRGRAPGLAGTHSS